MTSAIIHAGQLVTVAGPTRARVGHEFMDLGIIEDGAVIFESDQIVRIGTTDQLRSALRSVDDVTDAEGSVVTPGLVDAHTHLVFSGNRSAEFEARARGMSYVEIARSGGGIMSTVRSVRETSEDDLLANAMRHAHWLLSCGTTTAESKSGYGLDLENELKILRVNRRLTESRTLRLVSTFLGAHTIPPEFRDQPDGYVNLVIYEMLPAVSGGRLAEWCDVFCESIAFDHAQTARIGEAAKASGLGLRLHVDQLTNNGGAQLAAQLGAKTADHLEMVDSDGIAQLSQGRVMPVLLPGSVYALGHTSYPPARRMIEHGLPVVLATDFNPGSSPTPSLPMVMSLASTQMQMTPAETLTACTVNAAYSLNLGDQIGSLEPGKQADAVLWDCHDYREIAVWFGTSLAKRVWRAGQLLFSQ